MFYVPESGLWEGSLLMGRYHSEFMLQIFPKQVPTGTDLGNVEIKETAGKGHQYTIRPKNRREADFFLFYDKTEDKFFLVNTIEMPKFTKRRSISTNQVRKIAYFETEDIIDLCDEMKDILEDPSHIGGEVESMQRARQEVRDLEVAWGDALAKILSEIEGGSSF